MEEGIPADVVAVSGASGTALKPELVPVTSTSSHSNNQSSGKSTMDATADLDRLPSTSSMSVEISTPADHESVDDLAGRVHETTLPRAHRTNSRAIEVSHALSN